MQMNLQILWKEQLRKQIEEEKIQMEYNIKNNITPKTIKRMLSERIKATFSEEESQNIDLKKGESLEETIDRLTKEMMEYAKKYEFEKTRL